jgi:galactose-1-phosphate uridylyltransferase
VLKQEEKIEKDWARVGEIIVSAGASKLHFTYYWMLINSRCYYWEFAQSRKPEAGKTVLPVDECVALCPFADYFNHSSEGVS